MLFYGCSPQRQWHQQQSPTADPQGVVDPPTLVLWLQPQVTGACRAPGLGLRRLVAALKPGCLDSTTDLLPTPSYKWVVVYTLLATVQLLHATTTTTTTTPMSVCRHTYNQSPGAIDVHPPHTSSYLDASSGRPQLKCEYYVEAPLDNIITLNFTTLCQSAPVGRQASQAMRHNCLPPKLNITEITATGHEKSMVVICFKHKNSQATQVFQSDSHLLKLTFEWQADQYCGFTLTFDFHMRETPCEFRCADQSCLPDTSLVCNSVDDCQDGSDEALEECQQPSRGHRQDPYAASSLVHILVIVVAVVVALGLIVCCVGHYRLTTGLLSERRHHHDDHRSTEHYRLHPQSRQSQEVVYVPGYHDSYERELQQEREHQIRLQSMESLPPSIAISKDGEEGYANSQRMLQHASQLNQVDRESVRPPPNKTIFDGESPPPYRSRSFGSSTGYQSGKMCSRASTSLSSSDFQHAGDSPKSVMRCSSMTNNNTKPQNSNLNSTSLLPLATSSLLHSSHHQCRQHSTPAHQTTAVHPQLPRTGQGQSGSVVPPSGHSRSSSGSDSSTGSGAGSHSNYGPPPQYADVYSSLFNRNSDSNV